LKFIPQLLPVSISTVVGNWQWLFSFVLFSFLKKVTGNGERHIVMTEKLITILKTENSGSGITETNFPNYY
jgi:hypothetical protein